MSTDGIRSLMKSAANKGDLHLVELCRASLLMAPLEHPTLEHAKQEIDKRIAELVAQDGPKESDA